MESRVDDIELKRGLVDYYLAQTYAEPNHEDRKAALRRTAATFDGIYQRDAPPTICRLPACWPICGTGEWPRRPATSIWPRISTKRSWPSGAASEQTSASWDSLFAQVDYFRLRIVAKQDPEKFRSEAAGWLLEYRRWKPTDGYQGVALELAKAKYSQAQDATGPAKVACLSEARKLLANVAGVRSPYQREALALRRKLITAAGGSNVVAETFDDAVALAEVRGGQPVQRAEKAYQHALELAERNRPAGENREAAVRESWAHARLIVAQGFCRRRPLAGVRPITSAASFTPAGR